MYTIIILAKKYKEYNKKIKRILQKNYYPHLSQQKVNKTYDFSEKIEFVK